MVSGQRFPLLCRKARASHGLLGGDHQQGPGHADHVVVTGGN